MVTPAVLFLFANLHIHVAADFLDVNTQSCVLQYFMHFTFQLKNWPNRKRMPAGNLILPQDSICHINLSLFNPTFPILLVTTPFTRAQSIILLFNLFSSCIGFPFESRSSKSDRILRYFFPYSWKEGL